MFTLVNPQIHELVCLRTPEVGHGGGAAEQQTEHRGGEDDSGRGDHTAGGMDSAADTTDIPMVMNGSITSVGPAQEDGVVGAGADVTVDPRGCGDEVLHNAGSRVKIKQALIRHREAAMR